MIVVRVELHSAITKRVTELARMTIANAGGTEQRGDYDCQTLRGRDSDALDRSFADSVVTRKCQVRGHERLKLHVWNLVAKALAGMGYGK